MSSEKYIGLDGHQATISVAVMESYGKINLESILEAKAWSPGFSAGLRGSMFVIRGNRWIGARISQAYGMKESEWQ